MDEHTDPLEELRHMAAGGTGVAKELRRIATVWDNERCRNNIDRRVLQAKYDAQRSVNSDLKVKLDESERELLRQEHASDAEIERLQAKLDDCEQIRASLKAAFDNVTSRLDASMPLPLDADGVPCRIGDSMAPARIINGSSFVISEMDFNGDKWCIYDVSNYQWFSTTDCRHVEPTPKPETIEDVRKSKDNLIAFLAQSGVMGWSDLNDFSRDFDNVFEHAYECGQRDGDGDARD